MKKTHMGPNGALLWGPQFGPQIEHFFAFYHLKNIQKELIMPPKDTNSMAKLYLWGSCTKTVKIPLNKVNRSPKMSKFGLKFVFFCFFPIPFLIHKVILFIIITILACPDVRVMPTEHKMSM